MTYRNKTYEVGDLVEAVWVDSNMRPLLIGIVAGFPEAWKGKKVNVLWNEIGMRTEWLNDIRKLKTE
jgi:hypothetical protein